ncbi:hypothetical protein FKM82_016356 [Ascaphus truei]
MVSTAEHMYACTWIRNHLEEHTDTCLPKQDVYDAYKRYCDDLCGRPLSVANFGKIIREIFPNIKARRLGGRGQSKYCYSGLRRKSVVSMPPLPSLDLKMAESSELTDIVQSYNNDVINASCTLICNWAEKILKRSFNNVVEVAQFLIQQHLINPRGANAELVLSMVLSENSQSSGPKPQKPLPDGAGNKRPESPDDTAAQNKTTNPQPGSPQQGKKRPPEPQKVSSSTQVDALVARLPVLLPRLLAEEKFVTSSLPIRFSPPVLAPKILPSPLTVSTLPFSTIPSSTPVTAGVNGTGLLSRPSSVISMILPGRVGMETHPVPKSTPNGSTQDTAAGCGAERKGAKRRAVSPSAASGEGSSKRKRGRPRKMEASQGGATKPPSQGSLGAVSTTAEEKSPAPSEETNKDSANSPSLPATDPESSTQRETSRTTHCGTEKSSTTAKELPQNLPASPAPAKPPEASSARGNMRTPGEAAPIPAEQREFTIQVSVIQDGRQSAAQRIAREAGGERRKEVSMETAAPKPLGIASKEGDPARGTVLSRQPL